MKACLPHAHPWGLLTAPGPESLHDRLTSGKVPLPPLDDPSSRVDINTLEQTEPVFSVFNVIALDIFNTLRVLSGPLFFCLNIPHFRLSTDTSPS